MPTPISSSSTPFVVHPTEREALEAAPAVTIPPVHIEGDAHQRDTGVAQLVKAHDAAKAPPDCHQQAAGAAVGTIPVGAAVLGTLAAVATGPLGVAAGLLSLFGASIYEGKELRSYYDCKTQ